MAMPLYGMSVAVLAEQLKSDLPSPMQVWYADDFSMMSSGRAARPLIKRLGEIGTSRGVFWCRKIHNTSARNGSQSLPPKLPPRATP